MAARSVMPATTGISSFPLRRRPPSTSVVTGYTETITSGRTRWISLSIPREHGADLLDQLRRGERLLDVRALGSGVGVARGIEHPNARHLARDAVCELERIHLRHHDVGDEQVDRAFAADEIDGCVRRRRVEHRVTGALEGQPDDVANDILIIDDENGSGHT